MYVKNLFVKNFRNYSLEEFSFTNGINILTGGNGQGKTNAAEAIFFLCTGYSPRANKDKVVVKFGEEVADVSATAETLYGEVSSRILFNSPSLLNFAYFVCISVKSVATTSATSRLNSPYPLFSNLFSIH